jgi:hypothetical protein
MAFLEYVEILLKILLLTYSAKIPFKLMVLYQLPSYSLMKTVFKYDILELFAYF